MSIFLSKKVTEDELTDLYVKYWETGENFTFQFAPEKEPNERKLEWLEMYTSILDPTLAKKKLLNGEIIKPSL
jgi:hypothetical protein